MNSSAFHASSCGHRGVPRALCFATCHFLLGAILHFSQISKVGFFSRVGRLEGGERRTGYPMQTISGTWRQVVPIGEDPPRFKNDDKMMMKVIFG